MAKPLFFNEYQCPRCYAVWGDEWCAQCDDDCPKCGLRHISPRESAETGRMCDHSDCIADDPAA